MEARLRVVPYGRRRYVPALFLLCSLSQCHEVDMHGIIDDVTLFVGEHSHGDMHAVQNTTRDALLFVCIDPVIIYIYIYRNLVR